MTLGERVDALLASRSWPQLTRARAVAAGVVLLAVPTFFGVFPSWVHWRVGVRIAIMGAWCLIAVAAVAASYDTDEGVRALSRAQRKEREMLRLRAAQSILRSLLASGTLGFPEHYTDFTVYLFDRDSGSLEPWFPKWTEPQDPDPRAFLPGKGATGTAWEREDVVVVRGTAVADDRYELDQAQQDYYAHFRTVASAPIWKRADTKIGILTVLSRDNDDYFETVAGQSGLHTLADTIGVVLTCVHPGE